MASLSLKKIYKKYDNGFCAVTDFNLEVADKEFVVFVGPSGCGKSTTLRMIAGLEDITEGEFYIGDKLVNDVEPKDRDIAMVFQSYALYPHMTVFDNMAFALKLRKVPKDEIKAKVEEAAKILGLEELLDRKPKALSGGQRQRVALGRAIVRSPKVFLMDEPLSNLDAKLRSNMRAEIINFVTKDGGEIEIPIGHYDRLKELGYEGKEVVLGIRPENISNDPLVLETYSHAKITSKVIVAELLGSEYIVHTDLNGENIKAIVHSRQNIKMGDELTFALDMNRAHYFDVDTELSILE